MNKNEMIIKSSEKTFDELKQEILNCRKCQEKFGFEPHPIVRGSANSKIMHISQAPSQNVHNTLKPWNDASGNRLRNEWYHISEKMFYDPDNFYLTSVAHCYPGKSLKGGDRLPPKICAKTWLVREIELVNNKMFILVGSKAANFFFPDEDFTSLVFKDCVINGKPAYVLPHPSPLNIKWFRDNPEFLNERVKVIEKKIHEVLG